jgi:biopolymer transport protein ExbD
MWSVSKGQTTPRRHRQNLEIGLTPLIDIVFLLLIFFMLTSRFVAQEGIKVDLPITEYEHTVPLPEDTIIYLKEDGRIYFRGILLTLEQLHQVLTFQRATLLSKPVEIQADRDASVQSMVSLLEVLRNLDAKKVTISTVHEAPPPSP